MKKVSIIGSGIAGLACALRFSLKGYDVNVFESNNFAGGKMSEIHSNGFRFDTGPSLLTMPHLIDELISLCGKKPNDYFRYKKLSENCRYFYDDGVVIRGFSNPDKFVSEAKKKTGTDGYIIKKYLRTIKFMYLSTYFIFLEKSLHKISTYLSFRTFISILKIPFLNLFTTMNSFNQSRLKNKKLVQLFNRFATYNGSNPYKAPGILNVISYLEFNQGAFFPEKGMFSIVQLLYDLCNENNVKFHFNSPVNKIEVENKKVVGVFSNGHFYDSDIVVSNIDVFYVYKKLLNIKNLPVNYLKQERSTSALIFYWGISKKTQSLSLHNIIFSSDYEKEFKQLTEECKIPDDPTIYINITSKIKADDSPENCENLFVMVNAPYDNSHNWNDVITKTKKIIIKKINDTLNLDLESLIVFEEILDPVKIEKKTGSYLGSLYGSSSNNMTSAFFRHPNFSNDIKDLYFCGGSVHPGGGIPLALNSAKIIDSLI